MTGSAIGMGLSAVGSIFGGLSASKAMKKVKKNLQGQQRENDDWFNRRYNEDVTERADAQRILNMTEDVIRNRNRQAAGTQAVMGGTEEGMAATKAANNEIMSDTMSRLAANGVAQKDAIELAYMQKKARLNDALNNLEIKKADAVTTAGQGKLDAGKEFFSI